LRSSGFNPFGPDPLSEAIRSRVREFIEQTVEEELEAALGAGRYERLEGRQGFRHGHEDRTIGTSLGPAAISVPRGRLFGEDGSTREWSSRTLPRYQRRTAEIDNAVVSLYLCGANTRRIKTALRPMLKGTALSRSAVSRLVTRLKDECERWRKRSLKDESFVYLYLDGFSVTLRCAGRVVSMTILGVVGVRHDGHKALVSLDLAGGESEEAWKSLVDGLVARGLDRPLLCVIDGCPGLEKALQATWRNVSIQRCTVHKLRNLLAKAPKHAYDAIRDDYHAIVYAGTEEEGRKAYDHFLEKWTSRCQRVAESLREGGEQLLTFYRFPRSQWKSLRTTNVIERVHEEFRRRIKTQASLPNEDSAMTLLVALILSGQVRLRRIDGWDDMAQVVKCYTKRPA
jgi:transposase-like protein